MSNPIDRPSNLRIIVHFVDFGLGIERICLLAVERLTLFGDLVERLDERVGIVSGPLA